MVISNQERQHPGILNGKIIERKEPRHPGMIFFNHLGDEMGGMIFGDNGGNGHSGTLTWDARKAATQAIIDNNELTASRLFLGKRRDNPMMLLMSDIKGKPRIRMQVAPDGIFVRSW